MPICLSQWSCPIFQLHPWPPPMLRWSICLKYKKITFINIYLFSYWSLFGRWWDILLVLIWMVLQSVSLPTNHIQHDDINPLGPQPLTHWGCVKWPYKRYKLEFSLFCPTFKKVWWVKVCLNAHVSSC
jgi:hypothetical protein